MGFISGCLKRLREGHRQEGLIVEHLLEVGNEPLPVGAVAVKAMTQLIEDPPLTHRGKGPVRHPERIRGTGPLPVPEQKNDLMGHGKLRCVAESAVCIVKLSLKLRKGPGKDLFKAEFPLLRPGLHQVGHRLRRGILHFIATRFPDGL